jgi:hypothetical protein
MIRVFIAWLCRCQDGRYWQEKPRHVTCADCGALIMERELVTRQDALRYSPDSLRRPASLRRLHVPGYARWQGLRALSRHAEVLGQGRDHGRAHCQRRGWRVPGREGSTSAARHAGTARHRLCGTSDRRAGPGVGVYEPATSSRSPITRRTCLAGSLRPVRPCDMDDDVHARQHEREAGRDP